MLEKAHKDAEKAGIVVVGVHAAGTTANEIAEFAKDQRLTYPILIDLPPPKDTEAFGDLSHRLKIDAIPFAIVIDQEGKIAGHGLLKEVLIKARDLARKSSK